MTFKQEETDPGVITDIKGEEPSQVRTEEKSEEKVVEPAETVEPTEEESQKKTGEEETKEEKEKEGEEPEIDWEKRAKKLEKERDNYKTALLTAKYKTLTLGKTKEDVEEKGKEWDETSDESQKETLNKVEKIVLERIEKRNEQGAIKRFLKKHPSLASNGLLWSSIVASYNATRGRETTDDIYEDLEDAYLISKRKDGTLKEDFNKAKQEGERVGAVKAKTAQMASVSGAGNHSVSKTDTKKGLSDSAINMASRMKTPLDKLEEEDESVTTVINKI